MTGVERRQMHYGQRLDEKVDMDVKTTDSGSDSPICSEFRLAIGRMQNMIEEVAKMHDMVNFISHTLRGQSPGSSKTIDCTSAENANLQQKHNALLPLMFDKIANLESMITSLCIKLEKL